MRPVTVTPCRPSTLARAGGRLYWIGPSRAIAVSRRPHVLTAINQTHCSLVKERRRFRRFSISPQWGARYSTTRMRAVNRSSEHFDRFFDLFSGSCETAVTRKNEPTASPLPAPRIPRSSSRSPRGCSLREANRFRSVSTRSTLFSFQR